MNTLQQLEAKTVRCHDILHRIIYIPSISLVTGMEFEDEYYVGPEPTILIHVNDRSPPCEFFACPCLDQKARSGAPALKLELHLCSISPHPKHSSVHLYFSSSKCY